MIPSGSPRSLRLALVIAASLLAGCASTRVTPAVELGLAEPAPLAVDRSMDEIAVARVVARVERERIGLPLPAGTRVHFYTSRVSLADGLVHDAGVTDDDAWELSRAPNAVTLPSGIFFRADRLAAMSMRGRVGIIAHELAHLSQFEMWGARRVSVPLWIAEGHADWVQLRVLDVLGIRPYPDSREDMRRAVVRARSAKTFPSLDALMTRRQWTASTIKLGPASTYGQAFLAVDWLVERYGADRLHEFLRRLAQPPDAREHWAAVFPIPAAQFIEEFRAHLAAME